MNNTYIEYLKGEKKSENTIKNYVKHVEDCLNFINKDEKDITLEDLLKYKNSISNQSLATIALKINSIKNYFKYLKMINVIAENPAIELSIPKVHNKVKPYIKIEDIYALINSTYSARNRAVIATAVSTGMRMEELCSITIDQWNEMKKYNQHTITIIGKGNKERTVYFNDNIIEYIEEYLAKKNTTSGYVFESYRGNTLDDSNLNRMLKLSAKKAGLPYWKDISIHYLRVAFATISNDNGIDIPTISAALGHSSIAVTSRYIKTNQENINSAMGMITF